MYRLPASIAYEMLTLSAFACFTTLMSVSFKTRLSCAMTRFERRTARSASSRVKLTARPHWLQKDAALSSSLPRVDSSSAPKSARRFRSSPRVSFSTSVLARLMRSRLRSSIARSPCRSESTALSASSEMTLMDCAMLSWISLERLWRSSAIRMLIMLSVSRALLTMEPAKTPMLRSHSTSSSEKFCDS